MGKERRRGKILNIFLEGKVSGWKGENRKEKGKIVTFLH